MIFASQTRAPRTCLRVLLLAVAALVVPDGLHAQGDAADSTCSIEWLAAPYAREQQFNLVRVATRSPGAGPIRLSLGDSFSYVIESPEEQQLIALYLPHGVREVKLEQGGGAATLPLPPKLLSYESNTKLVASANDERHSGSNKIVVQLKEQVDPTLLRACFDDPDRSLPSPESTPTNFISWRPSPQLIATFNQSQRKVGVGLALCALLILLWVTKLIASSVENSLKRSLIAVGMLSIGCAAILWLGQSSNAPDAYRSHVLWLDEDAQGTLESYFYSFQGSGELELDVSAKSLVLPLTQASGRLEVVQTREAYRFRISDGAVAKVITRAKFESIDSTEIFQIVEDGVFVKHPPETSSLPDYHDGAITRLLSQELSTPIAQFSSDWLKDKIAGDLGWKVSLATNGDSIRGLSEASGIAIEEPIIVVRPFAPAESKAR